MKIRYGCVWAVSPLIRCPSTCACVFKARACGSKPLQQAACGVNYHKQPCPVFHWFRRNMVTCRDITWSVCSSISLLVSFYTLLLLDSHVGYNWHWRCFFFLLPFLPGFPNEPAAEIALNTVKSWIEENPDKVGHARRMHIWNKSLSFLNLRSICGGSVIYFVFPVSGDRWLQRRLLIFTRYHTDLFYLPSQSSQPLSVWPACISNQKLVWD